MDPIGTRIALAASGGALGDYWVDKLIYSGGTLGIPTLSEDPVYVDADNNMYNVGQITSTSPKKAFIVKRNEGGVVQWARTLSDSTSELYFYTLTSDGTYIYCGGYAGSNGVVAVYDLNGNIQWQKTYQQSGKSFRIYRVAVDSASNIFIPHAFPDGGGKDCLGVVKLNSSGVFQWATGYRYSGDGRGNTAFAPYIAIDSSGNPIVAGTIPTYSFIANRSAAWVAKMNGSTGALTWVNMYAVSSQTPNTGAYSPGVDSSGNIYASIQYNGTYLIGKWNSSGTLQAVKQVRNQSYFTNVYVDHEDNVWEHKYGSVDLWDTSLNWQFASNFSNPNFDNLTRGSTSEGIYLSSGISHPGAEAYLPLDGSLTGTYSTSFGTTFQYTAVTSYTPSTPTVNTLSGTSQATLSLTASTSSFTDAADSNFGTSGRVYL